MELSTIILILVLHFIADFVLQTRYIGINKSKSNKILLIHIVIYGIPFMIIGFWYAIINAGLHFIVDYISSRWTSKLWTEKNIYGFFTVIGLDQLVHLVLLFSTYNSLVG